MPFKTLYTIRTTGAPIQAHDYQYNPDGLLVYPVCEDGITPHLYPVNVPWEQYQGITFTEKRLPAQDTPAPAQDPEPATIKAETFTITAQPTQRPTRTAPEHHAAQDTPAPVLQAPEPEPAKDPAPAPVLQAPEPEPTQDEPAPTPTRKLGNILDGLDFTRRA